MIKFPKIGQFRVVKGNIGQKAKFVGLDADGVAQFDEARPMPTLTFEGTVKMHGSNGAVVVHPGGTIEAQSRNRVLSLTSDNAGFCQFVMSEGRPNFFEKLARQVRESTPFYDSCFHEPITFYGEWCGPGIQQGIGLTEMHTKRFVLFATRLGTEENTQWVDPPLVNGQCIHSIKDPRFPTYRVTIDFDDPIDVATKNNEMIALTAAVEAECPVAKAFDVSGVGEGVVWRCTTPGYGGSDFWFKVKGEKHSASKVKVLKVVDAESAQRLEAFVENVITENRFNQAIEYLVEMEMPMSRSSLGDFIRWVVNDVVSEELDVMTASDITTKDLGKRVPGKCREWFFKHLETV